jgi:hypothetical protein
MTATRKAAKDDLRASQLSDVITAASATVRACHQRVETGEVAVPDRLREQEQLLSQADYLISHAQRLKATILACGAEIPLDAARVRETLTGLGLPAGRVERLIDAVSRSGMSAIGRWAVYQRGAEWFVEDRKRGLREGGTGQ